MQVYARLYHKAWETRVAAGEALGLLAEAFPHTTVADLAEQCAACGGGGVAGAAAVTVSNVVTFEEFNLKHILERGQALLASGGQVGGGLRRKLSRQGHSPV